MTTEQRIERFIEKHFPMMRSLIYYRRAMGEHADADFLQSMADDLLRLRYSAAEDSIDYYI